MSTAKGTRYTGGKAEVDKLLREWNLEDLIPHLNMDMEEFMALRKHRFHQKLYKKLRDEPNVRDMSPYRLRDKIIEYHLSRGSDEDEKLVLRLLDNWNVKNHVHKFERECVDMEEFESFRLEENMDRLHAIIGYDFYLYGVPKRVKDLIGDYWRSMDYSRLKEMEKKNMFARA